MQKMKSAASNTTHSNILIVDDDTAILESIQMCLELEGYSVCTANNARSALELAGMMKPKLVVLDVRIAEDDGREVAKRLRKSSETADIPIIMMSAHPNVRDSVLQAGADDFMPKPFRIEELLEYAALYTRSTKKN